MRYNTPTPLPKWTLQQVNLIQKMEATNLNKGDYCLATRWSDGEAWDTWAVGFYEGEIYPGRHSVVDSDGNRLCGGGFRRCQAITSEQGAYLLANAKDLEAAGTKLWELLPKIGEDSQ